MFLPIEDPRPTIGVALALFAMQVGSHQMLPKPAETPPNGPRLSVPDSGTCFNPLCSRANLGQLFASVSWGRFISRRLWVSR
jgi:hypothetical protein